jgi:hypothetical protein
MTTLSHYKTLDAGHVDPEEIRRLVSRSKAAGLIKTAPSKDAPARIDKSGTDVAAVSGDSLRSVWMDVDPGLAAHWLQNNFVNRPMSEDTVRSYARDMVNGVWVPTHQGVAFNDLDHLIDGQHRLSAIVMCGLTIRMMVTFGLPSQIAGKQMTTMDAVDRGKTRSVADQLKIQHGMKNGSAIAMICASIATMCHDDRTRRLTVGQTLDIYREFQDAIDWVIDFRPSAPGLRAKGVIAACAFAVSGNCKLKGPCHDLFTGNFIEGSTGSPLHQLREFLLSDEAKLLNRGTDRGLAELTLLALQLHVAGERPDRLTLSQAGLHAFRALQPKRVAAVARIFVIPG